MDGIFERCWLTAFVLAALSAGTFATDPVAPPAAGFDAFRLARTRNIFDPERRAIVTENALRPATASRPDSIALTGTMVTPGKQLAFFTGSRSDFNKVIGVRDKIADCTITGISSTHIDLERGGKALVLVVGKQLALDATGAISAALATPLAAPGDPAPSDSGASATALSTPPPPPAEGAAPPAPAPAGDKAEVLRRMMERRNKEMSK